MVEAIPDSKVCTRCLVDRPLSEFHAQKAGKYGKRSECKPCAIARAAAWRRDNPDKAAAWREANRSRLTESVRQWRMDNRAHVRSRERVNYAANAVAIRERKSKWREANRESLRAADRAKYWANPEVRRQKNARYRRENKAYWVQHRAQNREAYRDVQRRRRAAIANTKVSTFAVSDLQARIDYYGNKCWICRGPYEHLDHVKPLSKGGPHMLSNLRPSCAPCNHSKGNKWPFTIKENV